MLGKGREGRHDCDGHPAVFKHYKVMVKILLGKKVEYQNLEIFTTGLPQLLEMRRLHDRAFAETGERTRAETSRNN